MIQVGVHEVRGELRDKSMQLESCWSEEKPLSPIGLGDPLG